MNHLKALATMSVVVALVLQLLSLTTPFWQTGKTLSLLSHDNVTANINVGLWKTCVPGPHSGPIPESSLSCSDLNSEDVNGELEAARGLIIGNVVLSLFTGGVLLLSHAHIHDVPLSVKAGLLLRVAFVLLLQGLLQASGIVLATRWLHTVDTKSDSVHTPYSDVSYGWSLYGSIGAAVFYVASSAFAYAAFRNEKALLEQAYPRLL